ncbi:MAG: PDZ domain-containing protein, partial [Proteobacteria bacterium]|nr:PDZ domain-containing protein [Pseudomonadota bacterium]
MFSTLNRGFSRVSLSAASPVSLPLSKAAPATVFTLLLFVLVSVFSSPFAATLQAAEPMSEVLISEPGVRTWLGVTTRELDEFTARMLAIDPGEIKGLVVIDVIRGGPADEAGIVRGDVLLSIDDKEIPGYEEFKDWISELDVGSTLKVLVDKGGVVKDVLVTLGSTEIWPDADSPVAGMKEYFTSTDELHTYHWMGEAEQYDYIYSLAMGTLELTPARRRRARALMSSYEKKMLRYSADINIAEVELRELLAAEPIKLKAVNDKITFIAKNRTELRFLRIKTHVGFKKLLT